MALYGAFDKSKHFAELDEVLDVGNGVISPATRRQTALRNLTGDDDFTVEQLTVNSGVTAGTVTASKAVVAGDSDDHVIDFSSLTLADSKNLIRGDVDFENVTGWIRFTGNVENDAFAYSMYLQPTTSGSAKLLGVGNTGILASGASVNVAEAAQLHILAQSGSTITTRGGDATAGIHPVWAKVGGDAGATWDSGCRVAPLWSDIQISGADVSGEESFGLLVTAGGSDIRSLIRWEGTADSTRFLETEKALGNGFLASSGFDTTQSNDPDGFLTVNIGGTNYGIPLMAAS